MKEETARTAAHAKNPTYEGILASVNERLREGKLTQAVPRLPVIFITGLPRSGTTLIYQLLAASGSFGYISNLMARFPAAPAVGADIQTLLQPLLTCEAPSFRSRGGGTQGWFEPHEFGYYWERHFPFEDHHQPSQKQLGKVDTQQLASELAELEVRLARPLLFKSLILNFVLPSLSKALPTACFVEITRDPVDVAASILRMREEYYGDARAWFSVRPDTVDVLLGEAPLFQVASQMRAIGSALQSARSSIAASQWLRISYDDVCRTPRDVVRRVIEFVGIPPDQAALRGLPTSFSGSHSSITSISRQEILRALTGQ